MSDDLTTIEEVIHRHMEDPSNFDRNGRLLRHVTSTYLYVAALEKF